MFPGPVSWHMLMTVGFELIGVHNRGCTVTRLHLEIELRLSTAADMKSLVTALMAALNTRAHLLSTDVALESPSILWDFLNVCHRLH